MDAEGHELGVNIGLFQSFSPLQDKITMINLGLTLRFMTTCIIIDGHVKTTLACLKYRYSSCPFASIVDVKICLSSVVISFNFMIMQLLH